jgi:ubiquinone biosynthesis protein
MILRKRPNPLQNASRLRTIAGVFARHGFQDLVERLNLGRSLAKKITDPGLEGLTAAARTRLAFEALGPTFVKLGQLLATRPDLIPIEFVEEFKKLHDQAPTLPFEEIRKVLDSHFDCELSEIFSSFDEAPLAAASIAQVHQAVLLTGEEVVVKVQRPGIDKTIKEDLNVLYFVAKLLDRYVAEAKLFNPVGIVNEFFKSLELETNFIVEANNIRRFQQSFHDDPDIVIPGVNSRFSGRRVLVMEKLKGIPLSQQSSLEQEGIDKEQILKKGLRAYLKMVFMDGLFHGDLHAGNIFVLPNNQVGLIDFGVVGRLNAKTQGAIVNMMLALANEDYDRLAYQYVDLAPYSETVDVDRLARQLRDLIAPYFGLTLKNVNVGKLLMDSTAVAASHQLVLPSELVMFFKSLVTVEGMARLISSEFDLLSASLEFADELIYHRLKPQRVFKELCDVSRDVVSLVQYLPRQIRQFARKVNSPDYSVKVSIAEIDRHSDSVDRGSSMIFLGLMSAALTISSTMILVADLDLPTILGLPALSVVGYALAAALALMGLRK